MKPGRSCPLDYRYAPNVFNVTPELTASCLYVVGGLYGNAAALDAIGRLAAREAAPPALIFNGDFNWFNVDRDGLIAINERVLQHRALRGNVETELANDDPAAGCGCGYPEFVGDAEVDRSNQIMERLRHTARGLPALRKKLASLPMFATANVGDASIAIVHGDCESLAGWGLSREALALPAQRATVAGWFGQAQVDVIASSHSCLPVMRDFATSRGRGVVINNGAAGMPNFAHTRYGVITRIGITPSPHTVLYGTLVAGAHVDALAVHYDLERWHRDFDASWPPGSPAHLSYSRRLMQGPDFHLEEAVKLASANSPQPASVAA